MPVHLGCSCRDVGGLAVAVVLWLRSDEVADHPDGDGFGCLGAGLG
jgi:hypothetical protein